MSLTLLAVGLARHQRLVCDGLNFGGVQGEGKTKKRGNRGGGGGIRRGGEIEEKVEEIVRGSLRDDGEG